jgi:F-type H+-transporting ATPase subunit b
VFVRCCHAPVLGFLILALSTTAWAADDPSGHNGPHADASTESAGDEDQEQSGGSHNEFDLTHADATDALIAPDEWKADLAIYTFVLFVLLLAILGKFAWGPIVAGLDKREESIVGKIAEAKRLSEEAKAQLDEHKAQLAGAADEVRGLLDQGRKDADAAKQQILDEAQQAAKVEKNRALREIAAAKSEALTELAQKSADAAVGLAGRIVRKQLTSEDHAELIQQALEQFPSDN